MPRKLDQTPLTPQAIVNKAAQLIARDGVAAFSMRKLAAELRVNPMAIYYYLPNKEAILQAVVEAALTPIALPKPEDWQAAVGHVARAYYAFAQAQPELFAYVVSYDRSIAVAFEVDEYLVAALQHTGMPPRVIVQIVNLVLNWVTGLSMSTIRGALGHAREVEAIHQAFRELPEAQFAALTALAAQLTPDDLLSDFDFALRVLLAGIASQLPLQAT